MKNFIIGWFVWQIAIIGVIGMFLDLNRADNNRTVDCSSVGYTAGLILIDVTVPLIQFTNMGPRDCSPTS